MMSAAAPPAASSKRMSRFVRCGAWRLRGRAAFPMNGFPMHDELRRLAMNLEPGKRVVKHVAMRERGLDAWRRSQVAQAPL